MGMFSSKTMDYVVSDESAIHDCPSCKVQMYLEEPNRWSHPTEGAPPRIANCSLASFTLTAGGEPQIIRRTA